MNKLLLIAGIAVGMNASPALAQHEDMPGHDKMPPGDHAKHKKKKDGEADKKPPPKPKDSKKEGDAHRKPPPK